MISLNVLGIENEFRRILENKDEVQYGATRGRMSDARKMLEDLEKFAESFK